MSAKNLRDADAKLIKLADAIMAEHIESERLSDLRDATKDRTRVAELDAQISAGVSASWTMRATLATLRATTTEGFRAKARVVRTFNNAFEGCDPYTDDAMAWSLAGDLLGQPSRFGTDKELAPRRAELAKLTRTPPWRKQFPPYKRQPPTLAAWLKTAEKDFVAAGVVEASQLRTEAQLLASCREDPEAVAECAAWLLLVCERWETLAKALKGEAIRHGVAQVRAKQPESSGAVT
jgi:hypothetical protein